MVLHGPEIIDTGYALRLMDRLRELGSVRVVLGGTMGRLALIDASMQDAVEISPRRRPSQSIRDLDVDCDIIFLLNLAKSRESGLAFGAMVARAAGEGRPLIQIDCGGGFVSLLRGDERAAVVAGRLAFELGLDLLPPASVPNASDDGKGGRVRRALYAVFPGELISVNGTVIGRATESRVEIEAKEGRIIEIKGVAVKQHGLEKIDHIDLRKAIIRSGSIRRTATPQKSDASRRISGREEDLVEAAFIDHCAEDAFEAAREAGVVVSVGDDTTAIAADILSRLGIVVMGIVDGDMDHLGGGICMMEGSIIFRVEPGHDDVVGRLVMERIFQGGERIRIAPGLLAERIKELAGGHLLEMDPVEAVRAHRHFS